MCSRIAHGIVYFLILQFRSNDKDDLVSVFSLIENEIELLQRN
jgi:hypothetical protein